LPATRRLLNHLQTHQAVYIEAQKEGDAVIGGLITVNRSKAAICESLPPIPTSFAHQQGRSRSQPPILRQSQRQP
jgi:hypothetical protein